MPRLAQGLPRPTRGFHIKTRAYTPLTMTVKMEHPVSFPPNAASSAGLIMDPTDPLTPAACSTDLSIPSASPSTSINGQDNDGGNAVHKGAANGTGQTSSSKRPPRKSTLTQQQKNQKRQRATQDQLTTLEYEFNKNPTPTANVREAIAEKINMTERSVQIWFQNRYADSLPWAITMVFNLLISADEPRSSFWRRRVSKPAKTSTSFPNLCAPTWPCKPWNLARALAGAIWAALVSCRSDTTAFWGAIRMAKAKFVSRDGRRKPLSKASAFGEARLTVPVIHHLTCRSLSIGKWTRVGQNTMDLIIFYSPDKCTMTYYINNEQAGYKIEYPFSYVKNIYLENDESEPTKLGGIVIELNQPPHFFMDSCPTTNGFYQCRDFTEDLQASRCLVHHLGGNPKVLSGQMAKLISLESFMSRHSQAFCEGPSLSISAPVSPQPRPSSQPAFPQQHMGLYQEQWGIGQMHSGAMRPPGHKRQRSRSVPGPVDLAMFQSQPMPSFYIQPPGDMGPPQHNPHIYAPIPQQPPGMGANLRIDTQAGFGLDMRQYPMSATTASPSEFPPSPGYFTGGPEPGPMPASNLGTPYGNEFLSPMVNADPHGPTSMSPYATSAEPSIVDQSPPMTMLGRPGSADMYPGNDGSCAVSEDGQSLNEMYSKHSINLPMHTQSPGFAQQQQHYQHQAELDMEQLVQFDTFDTASLSPEAVCQVSK